VISILIFDCVGNFTRLHVEYFLIGIVRLVRILLHDSGDPATLFRRSGILGIAFGEIRKGGLSCCFTGATGLGNQAVGFAFHGSIEVFAGDLQNDLLDFDACLFEFGLERVVFVLQFFVADLNLLTGLVLIDEDVANLFLRDQNVVVGFVLIVVGP